MKVHAFAISLLIHIAALLIINSSENFTKKINIENSIQIDAYLKFESPRSIVKMSTHQESSLNKVKGKNKIAPSKLKAPILNIATINQINPENNAVNENIDKKVEINSTDNLNYSSKIQPDKISETNTTVKVFESANKNNNESLATRINNQLKDHTLKSMNSAYKYDTANGSTIEKIYLRGEYKCFKISNTTNSFGHRYTAEIQCP